MTCEFRLNYKHSQTYKPKIKEVTFTNHIYVVTSEIKVDPLQIHLTRIGRVGRHVEPGLHGQFETFFWGPKIEKLLRYPWHFDGDLLGPLRVGYGLPKHCQIAAAGCYTDSAKEYHG